MSTSSCGPGDALERDHKPGHLIRALLEDSAQPGDSARQPVLSSTGDTIHLSPDLLSFYERREYQAAWTDEGGFLPRGEALVRALQGATAEGLDPRVYHLDGIEHLVTRANREYAQGLPARDVLGSLDVLLTEAFIRYTSDIVRGTIAPESTGIAWEIPRGDPTDAAFLESVLEQENFDAALASLRPSAPFYDHLRGALGRYQGIVETGGWPAVKAGPTLKVGDRSDRVLAVRRRLTIEADPLEAPLVAGATDPMVFDSALSQAVSHFQERHGMDSDGAVGAGTVTAMNVPADERLLAVQLNLDRWRWLPKDLGERYILVNVAGFELSVMEGTEEVLGMNVVVGKDARTETPLFQDTLEHIVVNPYWNVPPGIARDEIMPIAARDPGYLGRNGYEVVSRGGETSVRQRPGRNNALGRVKFVFPNPDDIYLHDTQARHLFRQSRRAFSHGCIRLEKPDELAEYLMRTSTSLPAGSYDSFVASGRERWVRLEKKLPIYILYFTAWAEGDGRVFFYGDVYDRDEAVVQMARENATGTPLARLAGAI